MESADWKQDQYGCNLQPNNINFANEPPRGKTNNVVSEQVQHKPTCTSIEKELEA